MHGLHVLRPSCQGRMHSASPPPRSTDAPRGLFRVRVVIRAKPVRDPGLPEVDPG